MNQLNPSTAGLVDAFANHLREQLAQGHPQAVTVARSSVSEDGALTNLVWFSWNLSIDPASQILAGAPLESWRKIADVGIDSTDEDLTAVSLARLRAAVEKTAQARFGAEVTCSLPERKEGPAREWTSVSLAISKGADPAVSLRVSLSPDVERALGGLLESPAVASPDASPAVDSNIHLDANADFHPTVNSDSNSGASGERFLAPQARNVMNPADILMQVEMPVSISLGRTKMRMKDLLNLTNGSVVELDQELADEVEIRVNNCVIAYGEVVAVDGNYAVRVLRLAPNRNPVDPREAASRKTLPERAA